MLFAKQDSDMKILRGSPAVLAIALLIGFRTDAQTTQQVCVTPSTTQPVLCVGETQTIYWSASFCGQAPTSTEECTVNGPTITWDPGSSQVIGPYPKPGKYPVTSPTATATFTYTPNGPDVTCPTDVVHTGTGKLEVVVKGWEKQSPDGMVPTEEKTTTTPLKTNVRLRSGAIIPLKYGEQTVIESADSATSKTVASGNANDGGIEFIKEEADTGDAVAKGNRVKKWKWTCSGTPTTRDFQLKMSLKVTITQKGCSDNGYLTKAWAKTSSQGICTVDSYPGPDGDTSYDQSATVSQTEQDSWAPGAGWPPTLTYTFGHDEWTVGPSTLVKPVSADFSSDGRSEVYTTAYVEAHSTVAWNSSANGPQSAEAKAEVAGFTLEIIGD